MANLVAPVAKLEPIEERIIEFKGLNRREVVEDGEMSDMKNLTADNYPVLSPRKPRGTYELPEGVVLPLQIMTRYEKVALIAVDDQSAVNFYYDGEKIDEVVGLSEASTMVAINTKICFFPEKTYLEVVRQGSTITIGAFGHLDNTVSTEEGTSWPVTLSNTDVKITLPAGTDYDFAYDDAIDITGTLTYTPQGGSQTTMDCQVSCIIERVDGNVLTLPRETFIELTGEGATLTSLSEGTISRDCPNLDYVIEWNNRLWGANNEDNTIYACKLGDPKNWKYYQGTGLDSYYAQQGTDGVWTGAATQSNHLIFFKQASMARVYGSAPSNFQVSNTKCFGVEEGDDKSIAVVNDRVFYKSVIGIMCYEGGAPYCVSDKINTRYRHGVGGTEGNKYYFCGQSEKGGNELLVLDIDRGMWHREDYINVWHTATIDNRLYFITHSGVMLVCSVQNLCSDWLLCSDSNSLTGEVKIVNPIHADENVEEMEWYAVFGPFDEYIEYRKVYSRILLRLNRKESSTVRVYISIDEGDWELVQEFDPAQKGGDYIPIVPRRCDRYSIKVEGTGSCSIKSLTRKVRRGTGGRL